MDIQDQITRFQGAKNDLVEASNNFELNVPQPQKIDTYAEEILKYSRLQNNGYQQDYGNTLSVSIPATTHGQGTSPFVDVYYLENSNLIKMSAYPENGHKVEIASNGDVTVTFPVLTSGRIFVIGKKTVTGIEPTSGVESFNGRTGAVIPQNGDYEAGMITNAVACDGGARIIVPEGAGTPPYEFEFTDEGTVPAGGAAGQVLKKKTDADYDIEWGDGGGGTSSSGVESFNGRTGAVTPQTGDYTAEMVGAVTNTEVTQKLNEKITYGTTDLTAGTSDLATGNVYLVYES